MVLILRAGIVEEGKDPIPQHRIEVPIGIGVDGGEIVLSPPDRLAAIRTTAMESVPRVRRAAIANQIRRILMARLPERRVDGMVEVNASDTKQIKLQTVLLESRDGWLHIQLQ